MLPVTKISLGRSAQIQIQILYFVNLLKWWIYSITDITEWLKNCSVCFIDLLFRCGLCLHAIAKYWSDLTLLPLVPRQRTGSTLVQVMACRLFGAKPLPEPMLTHCQLDPEEQTSVEFKSKYKAFHYENAFKNVVCEVATILSRRRWVNSCCDEFIIGNIKIQAHFSMIGWHKWLKSVYVKDENLFILHSQYHGCWWPGDARRQGISSLGIDLVDIKYSDFNTRRVNTLGPNKMADILQAAFSNGFSLIKIILLWLKFH